MLNGMNLAAISEFVHEIKQVPREAQIAFGVEARLAPDGSALVSIETIHAGSIRIPRRFSPRLSTTGMSKDDREWQPTPQECLLAGLGSCALIVYVQALTLRGVALDGLEVAPWLDFPRIGYDVRVHGDIPNELGHWVAEQVKKYSPNHRTIAEPNPVSAFVNGDAIRFDHSEAMPLAARTSLRLRWRFGTQVEVRAVTDRPHMPAFHEVDQPKQLLGIDRAPNPQEWLLAGFAGELALGMADRLSEQERPALRVHVTGRVDLRGTLGVDAGVPVKVQDVQVRIDASPTRSLTAAVRESIEAGVVSRLIAQTHNLVCDVPTRFEQAIAL
jgi:uncharacterized OsmC-like protein